MKLDNSLLEKYHLQQCSAEERELVEEWLFSTEPETEGLDLPEGEDRQLHKQAMWDEIRSITAEPKYSFWNGQRIVAASLLAGILLLGGYACFTQNDEDLLASVSVINSSAVGVKNISYNTYNIAVGPMTRGTINNLTGLINFSGSILFSPKKDITVTFEGSSEKMSFKMGQTYIILNGNTQNDRIIIVNEKNINQLPPILQQQVFQHFNI